MPARPWRGQDADTPSEIPARGWKDILWRVWNETLADHVSVISAGVAFFGLLAIFPAIAALISIAGYFLDPADVASRLDALMVVLPQNAASIIRDQVVKVTGGDQTATGVAALIGLALALYGATKGMMTLIEGLNVAYDEDEKRGFVALYLTGLALTLFLIVGLLVAFAVMIVIPAALAFVGLPDGTATVIAWLQWPLLGLLAVFGLAVVYRFGPSRESAKWRWVSPGAAVATVLWLLATLAFAIYAQNFASYNETYGTLGGVIALLTWLWLSAFVVLLGAELNAEMEHQTARDSTTGQPLPLGQRGAVMADTVAGGLTPEGSSPAAAAPARPRGRDAGAAGELADTVRHRPVAAGLLALAATWRLLTSTRRS